MGVTSRYGGKVGMCETMVSDSVSVSRARDRAVSVSRNLVSSSRDWSRSRLGLENPGLGLGLEASRPESGLELVSSFKVNQYYSSFN